jgi:signal transduction histidine kinase
MGELSEEQRKAVSTIEQRSRLLSETVNDLLSLAKGRAELSTLKRETVDLNAIVKDCIDLMEPQIEKKCMNVEMGLLDRAALVSGSREAFLSITTNLLSNAVKYSPPGRDIAVRITEEDGELVLEVKDTGIGIAADELERIFDEFYRAKNAKGTSVVGTGLGLSIVKSKVEQHGGTIEVTSDMGRGTTFKVRLRRMTE